MSAKRKAVLRKRAERASDGRPVPTSPPLPGAPAVVLPPGTLVAVHRVAPGLRTRVVVEPGA